MTNYMTVLECEIQDTANRIWRLEQTCTDEYARKHELTENDRKFMRNRLEATKALYRSLVEQFACFHDEEEGKEYEPSKWNLSTKVDVENSPNLYEDALNDYDGFEQIDTSLMDIMDPLSFLDDLSAKKKKEIAEECEAFMESVRKRAEAMKD